MATDGNDACVMRISSEMDSSSLSSEQRSKFGILGTSAAGRAIDFVGASLTGTCGDNFILPEECSTDDT